MISKNTSLRTLDISKNKFGDAGLSEFCHCLKYNNGLTNLNISKNFDVTDEEGLRELAKCLIVNKYM